MKLKVKIICGYRQDEEYTIDADEAHKAYYLFHNKDKRGVFSNGLAIDGKDIHRIVPDYHGTMGWNPSHRLDSDDWNEIHKTGAHTRLTNALQLASDVAKGDPANLNTPLSQLLTTNESNPHLLAGKSGLLAKMKM